jgi:putative selenate reductase
MTELFRSIATEQLVAWIFTELDSRDSIFGVPRRHFHVPVPGAPYRSQAFGQPLGTPIGPAAGPHTQMAQNIIAAWLCGARYIELKTVQTLDELDVSKPCIDMQDEGYNVEWSQELKVHESFDEYLRAWVLIHALHHHLGFSGTTPDIVFNLSVGYDLAGIRQPNVQWFLDQVENSSARKQEIVDLVGEYCPAVHDIDIPDRISDNVTLSTMHGCPPEDIESICRYLLRERGLHTLVKLNPTLLGAGRVRSILLDDLGYADVSVPDAAFEHDLAFTDAVPMLRRLQDAAADSGREFGVKLTNTLEVENTRSVFAASEKTSYLSGRPLHALSVNLAATLAEEFDGALPMSFSAGATCYNVASLLAAGMRTVTTCSDLLKTGGYLRLLDYVAALDTGLADVGTIDEHILRVAGTRGDVRAAALANLQRYAEAVRSDPDYIKTTLETAHTKTARSLGRFDCIAAPCVDECPLHQQVPQYLHAVRDGDFVEARRVVDADNPLPCVLGRICDHQCEHVCVRNHLDQPVAIRDVKRFVTDSAERAADRGPALRTDGKVAIIGAGPGGIAAALELARGGCSVEIFEQQARAGGMVGTVVPDYRLPPAIFERDYGALTELGVDVHFGAQAGRDFTLASLHSDGFDHIVITVGAQAGRRLGLDGEDCAGIVDALAFLRQAKGGTPLEKGPRVGVIGGGDTAMDCARTAARLPGTDVKLIYRRGMDEMPADREELEQLLEEGIDVVEFARPVRIRSRQGRLAALECSRTHYSGGRDAAGRKRVEDLPQSEFDLPLDALILAISQQPMLDFLADTGIRLNERGYIEADPDTFETSLPGVYAGGDAANAGPATIVKAAAAGKAIARHILGPAAEPQAQAQQPLPDLANLVRQRSRRLRRSPAPVAPVEARDGTTEVMLTYPETEARTEASRCLGCDAYCGLCVSVCPNLAVQTWRCDEPGHQPFQVAVIADLCNECGNCTTFCPTSGQPYKDKPRLYLDRADFEAQDDNAFMVYREDGAWAIDARFAGATRHVRLDAVDAGDEQERTMLTLLRGLSESAPFLPRAVP